MLDSKMMTFLKVAELKNYTRAAGELNLTQPAVSQHIKKLEEHYGCKLVDAAGKGVRLTEQGEALYSYASFQSANEEQLIRQLHKLRSPVRLGATLSIADYYLPPYLSSFIRSSGELLSVMVKNTQAILEMLLKNELDCAFIEGLFDQSLFAYHEFCSTRFVPVVRRGHPLAGRKASLKEVHGYPLILREAGSGTREIYENHLYEQNDSILSAVRVYEISSFGIIKDLLQHSDAVSFMYEGVASDEVARGKLCLLDIEGFFIQRPLYFVYPANSLMSRQNEVFYRQFIGSGEGSLFLRSDQV